MRPGPCLRTQTQMRGAKEVRPRAGLRGWTDRLPPIGAAKQQPTPTAQAAASISVFRDSFWQEWWKWVSAWPPQPPLPLCFPQGFPYLIDATKEGEELAEQGSTHAGDMHKRALGVWEQMVMGKGHTLTLAYLLPPLGQTPSIHNLELPLCQGASRCPGHRSAQ